jgi:hypothetical protein
VGDFEPSVLKIKDFEVGVLTRKKGFDISHYHKIATEITCLISGKMKINGLEIEEGDIFIIEPNVVADAFFYEDSKLLVVKLPSVIGDKYEI